VNRIVKRLVAHHVPDWIDRSNVEAREVWRRGITQAIRQSRHFVACFSSTYSKRGSTYMDDEIHLALSEMWLLGLNRYWFVPVMLDGGRIPRICINDPETLADLHFINFPHDWEAAAQRLIELLAT
jgi:hypothetical protein